MGRRDILKKVKSIRGLIRDNQYTAALTEIKTLDLNEVPSIEDLYLYAELYEKAERMDMKKKIYYIIYERTKSRHVLAKLLRLVLRLGDLEEARELFLNYEFSGAANLETYELRYMLARAEGSPRSTLINILEELKHEEYTEEWGFQLARLYELEGRREDCINECKDLKLWFGEGKIIDRAMALKEKVESPDWVVPNDEEIPEPVEEDTTEYYTYAAAPLEIKTLDKEEKNKKKEIEKEENQVEDEIKIDPSVLKKPDLTSMENGVSSVLPTAQRLAQEKKEEADIVDEISSKISENIAKFADEKDKENVSETVEENETMADEEAVVEEVKEVNEEKEVNEFSDKVEEETESEIETEIETETESEIEAETDEESEKAEGEAEKSEEAGETGEAEETEEAEEEEEDKDISEVIGDVMSKIIKKPKREEKEKAEKTGKKKGFLRNFLTMDDLEEETEEEEKKEKEIDYHLDMSEESPEPGLIQRSKGKKKEEAVELKEEKEDKNNQVDQEEKQEEKQEEIKHPDDISDRGIKYFTLKNTINKIRQGNIERAHFVFAGGEERITLAVAKRIAKELNHVGYFSAKSIVKISADKLNGLELEKQIEKVKGGCMLVTHAAELNKNAVNDLIDIIDRSGDKIVIMLSGAFDEMDCFLDIYPDLAFKFNHKIRM